MLRSAAEGFVGGDPGGGDSGAGDDDFVLGGEGDALGVEHGEEVGDAVLIALAGEVFGFFGGGGSGFEVAETNAFAIVGGEGVFGFFEGEENGLFVAGEGSVGAVTGGGELGADATEVERGPSEAGAETEAVSVASGEAGKGLAFDADAAVEGDAREEIGGGDADAGGLCFEGGFGGADVGAAAEEFGGGGDAQAVGNAGLGFGGGELGAQGGGILAT